MSSNEIATIKLTFKSGVTAQVSLETQDGARAAEAIEALFDKWSDLNNLRFKDANTGKRIFIRPDEVVFAEEI